MNQPTKPLPKIRISLTILLAGLCYVLSSFLHTMAMPLLGRACALQATSSDTNYGLSQYISQHYFALPGWICVIGLLILWLPWTSKKTTKTVSMALLGLSFLGLSACSPYKVPKFVEIDTNETAWVVPLTGANDKSQQKFDSISFLESKKVAAKRIELEQVSVDIGRGPGDIEWKPAVRVVKVNRSLVTREWTDNDVTGTSNKKEAITVVTKDSIQLSVGLTITASIDEEDASTYLYYHGDRKLSEVIDQNIRSYAVADLTGAFSDLTLSEAQVSGNKIYQELFTKARVVFKTKGINIQYLGNAEGVHYKDPKVQEAINAKFIAEQSIKTAEQENKAQEMRNLKTISQAKAQADAAQMLMVQKEATQLQIQLEVQKMAAQAQVTAAEKWDGKLPSNIVPSNYPMLLNLGGASPASK